MNTQTIKRELIDSIKNTAKIKSPIKKPHNFLWDLEDVESLSTQLGIIKKKAIKVLWTDNSGAYLLKI